jgi:hypothetical protein
MRYATEIKCNGNVLKFKIYLHEEIKVQYVMKLVILYKSNLCVKKKIVKMYCFVNNIKYNWTAIVDMVWQKWVIYKYRKKNEFYRNFCNIDTLSSSTLLQRIMRRIVAIVSEKNMLNETWFSWDKGLKG